MRDPTLTLTRATVHALGLLPGLAYVFPAFRDMVYPVLLDGAMPGATGGRCSYLAADPFLVVRSRRRRVVLAHSGTREEIDGVVAA